MKKHLITLGMSAICMVNPYSCYAMKIDSTESAFIEAVSMILSDNEELKKSPDARSQHCVQTRKKLFKSKLQQILPDHSQMKQLQEKIAVLEQQHDAHGKAREQHGQSIEQLQTRVQQTIDQGSSDRNSIRSLEGASQQIKEQLQNVQAQMLYMLDQRKTDHQRLGELEALVAQLQQLQTAVDDFKVQQNRDDHTQLHGQFAQMQTMMCEIQAALDEQDVLEAKDITDALQPVERRAAFNRRGMAAAHRRINELKKDIRTMYTQAGTTIQGLQDQVHELQKDKSNHEKIFAHLVDTIADNQQQVAKQREDADAQKRVFMHLLTDLSARQHTLERHVEIIDQFADLLSLKAEVDK